MTSLMGNVPGSLLDSAASAASPTTFLWSRLLDLGASALQHVGPLVGRVAHQQLWPQIIQWMLR